MSIGSYVATGLVAVFSITYAAGTLLVAVVYGLLHSAES